MRLRARGDTLAGDEAGKHHREEKEGFCSLTARWQVALGCALLHAHRVPGIDAETGMDTIERIVRRSMPLQLPRRRRELSPWLDLGLIQP
jgi:hypothetical protein